MRERNLDMPSEKKARPGKVVRRNNNGTPQIAKQRGRVITAREKQAFLDHLSRCSNASASAEAAGRSYDGFNEIRKRDPEFAALWQDALQAGYAYVEALILERSRIALEAEKPKEGESEAARQGAQFALSMDADQILRLMTLHKRTVNGGRRGGNAPRPAASEEEAAAAIMKKLAVLRRRLDAKKG
jgi:hypothetical protein